ncbi:MAG: CDP-alcohol phosphatidyltransferase family protein [Gemmatimonadaceae bacterium]|nr:CDP-alcohol phosphatidyltransferase family protein [Gemmatimonadaceae bacterium]
MERGALFTLPNSVSLSRLFLALIFLLVSSPLGRASVIAAAAATDFLDGWLARRGKSVTTSGALIDPLADRAFVLTAVSAYLIDGIFTTSQYFLFLSRDLATAVGFVVAQIVPGLRPVVFQARMLGKIVTVLQLATLVIVLFEPKFTGILVQIIAVVSIASIGDYTVALWKARRKSPA